MEEAEREKRQLAARAEALDSQAQALAAREGRLQAETARLAAEETRVQAKLAQVRTSILSFNRSSNGCVAQIMLTSATRQVF